MRHGPFVLTKHIAFFLRQGQAGESLMADKNTGKIKIGKRQITAGQPNLKKNPNSLRAVFATIIRSYFDGSTPRAALALSKFGGIYASEKQEEKYKTLNDKSLEKILRDVTFVQYWQLESVARFLQIPTGVVLLISRLAAARRRGKSGEYEALLNGLKAFVECAEKRAGLLDKASDDLDINADFIAAAVLCFAPLQEVVVREADLIDRMSAT